MSTDRMIPFEEIGNDAPRSEARRVGELLMDTPTLRIRNLTKNFGNYAALRDLSLTINGGEFVALLGPNGAGKSTLIKILDGVHQATSGEVLLGDSVVADLSDERVVGFVHQDLGLIDDLSISENLRLGEPKLRSFGPFLNLSAENSAAVAALASVDLEMPVSTLVGRLSPAEKALVAVARVFYRGAKVMFIDEVTSTLPPTDARRVTDTLARSAERGATIIMVSHKLSEVMAVAHRVVVLIDGALAFDASTAGLDRSTLTNILMNHELHILAENEEGSLPTDLDPVSPSNGAVLLTLKDIFTGPLGPVDLQIRSGQVIGVGGLPGSGLHDLAFLICGEKPADAGRITFASGVGTAMVPPHRETQGGFDDWTVAENATPSSLDRWRNRMRFFSPAREADIARQLVLDLAVEPPNPEAQFGSLSGGNKQKVIFGRALLSQARLLVLCEPTRGVDIKTRQEIYSLIRKAAAAGAGVLVLSSDSEDLLTVSDQLTVILDGRLREPRGVQEFTIAELEALL